MSFLTPLYILGALSVAAPILFHLIRRTTRGEVPFSSLLFLTPSPPKLTRRSRIDNLFLLLLRGLALLLLAAAFARPFLRRAIALGAEGDERGRVCLLIDTSASMRRGDLWAKAKARALEAIAACRPGDGLAIFAFDDATRPVLGFRESAALDPSRRQAVARALVENLAPGWGSTGLGRALVDAAGAIEEVGDDPRRPSKLTRRIVLISDLPQGSALEALGDFEWPSEVELDPRPVAAEGSNAGLQGVAASAEEEPKAPGVDALRVRITNDTASTREAFSLSWPGTQAPPVRVYVPPGETRVARLPRPPGQADRVRLDGDAHAFDNTLYLATPPRETATILAVGQDAPDDPEGLLYYLSRAFEESPRRSLKLLTRTAAAPLVLEPGVVPSLVVLAGETSPSNAALLRQWAEAGATVLDVVTAPGKATALAVLAGTQPVEIEEVAPGGDAMLGEIAFDHPLFSPFAGPQYNDFTKIRFWKYRRIPADALGEARVVARFEGGDPAVIEKPLGKGRLVVFASSWRPSDSQLARSSKFVPLMSGLLEGPGSGPPTPENLVVRDPVPLPEGATAVRKPDGSWEKLAPGASEFAGTDAPGVYAVETPKGARPFAVNLDPSESKTAPMEVETLEQYGCRLAKGEAQVEADREAARQLKNAELEGRQKLWRPLVLAAIAILIVETWLAGWLGRPRPARAEAPAS